MRLAVVALLAGAPAAAQSLDCARAETSAERLVCTTPALVALDARVAARYAQALEAARALDAGAAVAEAEATLKATERAWIGGRDACWTTANVPGCLENSYLRREAGLVATWLLEDPTDTVAWACDGTPAKLLVTLFFDTELPCVRIERGDSIDTGTLVRSASGSRYIGSFGREIWIKGDEATYREPDPEGTQMTCVKQN